MEQSTDAVDHATIDRMADYVVARQKAKRAAAGVSEIVVDGDREPLAYASEGRIILAADTCCHDVSGRLLYTGAGSFECQSGLYIVSDLQGRTMKLLVK